MQCGLWVSCREAEALSTVPVLFVLGSWDVADLGMEAVVVVPVAPFDNCDLEVAAGALGAVELVDFGF